MGLWDELLKGTKRGLGALREQSRRATKQAKLRLDKAKLGREKDKLIAKLGHDVLTLDKMGVPLHDSLTPTLAEIARLEKAIMEKEVALRLAEGAGVEASEENR